MKHISYSQYSTYKKCPRSWYLSKVRRAPERPAWYTITGSAVHEMIEEYLRSPFLEFNADEYIYPLIQKARRTEPDTDQWMFALDDQKNPIIKERAVEHVRVCFERAVEYLEDIDVWEVEYDASGYLPGCEVEIKAFVDILGEHKKQGPAIVDWKTGKHKDRFQLDTYKALLGQDGNGHGAVDFKGYFAMLAPWASQSRYLTLNVDPAVVGAEYQRVYNKMKAKLYPTTGVDAVCGFCFQRDNCLRRSDDKERAAYYDRSEEDGLPF